MIEIKCRFTGKVLHSSKKKTIKEAVLQAIEKGANLESANLGFANLESANLESANLGFANLGFANLESANLESANLGFANLGFANLRFANLESANLGFANLRFANLESANLESANLESANLRSANLEGIKNYCDGLCHQIFLELFSREDTDIISGAEWSIIGKFSINTPCWDDIVDYPKKTVLRILKRLHDKGFTEYLDRYKEEQK